MEIEEKVIYRKYIYIYVYICVCVCVCVCAYIYVCVGNVYWHNLGIKNTSVIRKSDKINYNNDAQK